MARLLWIVQDRGAMRLCVLFQMTMPGAPCIFYGDEVGVSGGDDPYCRGAFPWHDEQQWDHELLAFYRRAIALRRAHPVLRTGKYETLFAEGRIYAFARRLEDREAIVVLNASTTSKRQRVPLPSTGDGPLEQA